MDNVERIDELFNQIENIGAAVNAANNATRRVSRPKVYLRNQFNQDPFQFYSEVDFKVRFHFTKHSVESVILPLIEEDLQTSHISSNRGLPLTPRTKLLIALRFYATGTFQTVCGDILVVSQATVCRCISQVSAALAKLLPKFVKFPNRVELQRVKALFEEAGRSNTHRGLINIVGAIDCSHIKINRPRNVTHSEVYRNRKGIFSVNTQIIVGPNMEIFDIVARWPGSSHDIRIFRNSRVYMRFIRREIQGVLVGDSGYPSLPFMLTPLLQSVTTADNNYNYAQIKTRNVVERFFGVWKKKFQCLHLGLRTKLKTTANVIIAYAVLHNIGIEYGDNFEEVHHGEIPQQHEESVTRPHIPSSAQGLAMRQSIIARFN